jgi:hypothetical protein
MSHPRDPQIMSNNSYKHVYFKYLAYQNSFEMSSDDHPRHSYKHVHFKYLAYLTSKCLEILSQTPNYLKLVQKIWNRKYYTIASYRGSSNGSKRSTRCFEAYPRTCKAFRVTIWDKGKKTTGRRKRSHVPANSGSTITWCTIWWHSLQCVCYADCVIQKKFLISGFHWIDRKAVRLSAIPLMSQNSRLYNPSL